MDDDTNSEDSYAENLDKSFITKILGEMNKQFNNKIDDGTSEDLEGLDKDSSDNSQNGDFVEVPEDIPKAESENSKDSDDSKSDSSKSNIEGKPRIVMCFRKPANVSPDKEETIVRRSKRAPVQNNISLKRSARRRSKDCGESVLQSAIARKEKSYNETNKPQRLTRQLKPTQKILENLANAAMIKQEKRKEKVKTERVRGYGKKNAKKIKLKRESSDTSESDSFKFGRSDCVSSQNTTENEESDVKEESDSKFNSIGDLNSATAQLIASRLCVCSKPTNIYAFSENNESIYCTAIDSIGKKLIGCNNQVNPEEMSMLRPSTRVPYISLCKIHRVRMISHNCCPTCGIFCTQGQFFQCENKHQYHRNCQIVVGDIECCPHCGDNTPKIDIYLNMETSSPPVFLATQRATSGTKVEDETVMSERDCNSPPIIPLDDLKLTKTNVKSFETNEYDVKDLLNSIKNGEYEEVAAILGSRSINLETFIEYDEDDSGTILHYTAKKGLLSAMHMLKIAGVDLDITDSEQNTPLMVAVLNFQNDAVKYLTKAGADLTSKGMDGMTALHLAAKCGNLDSCKTLLSAAVHIKGYINFGDGGGWTPLVWSCEHSHLDVVKFLLSEGANPLLTDVEENVALHWASFSGSSKIVELILNFGGEVNVVNSHGDSPLHIAARQDNFNVVLLLLARGAKIDLINKMNETPVECCMKNSKSYEALALNVHLQSLITVNRKPLTANLSNDISCGKEAIPVPCTNEVDAESLPLDYVYVTKNYVSPEIIFNHNMVKCNCLDNCSTESCSCVSLSMKFWYQDKKLISDFDFEAPNMIFECNRMCSCNDNCNNKLVQLGSKQYVQMFRTVDKGWGIRASKQILKGTFVSEYTGELISDSTADSRQDDSYFFDLDNRAEDSYCIDAKFYGNYTRFINHSCDPNLVPIRIFIDNHDLNFPQIALFAKRNIEVDEELSFNYGDEFWAIKSKYFSCKCKSDSCRFSEIKIQS